MNERNRKTYVMQARDGIGAGDGCGHMRGNKGGYQTSNDPVPR